MKTLLRLTASLAINAVPALGWFVEDWSAGTLLAIYWFENVVASLFIGARILLHRRLAPSRGHFRHNFRKGAGAGLPRSFLAHFLRINLAFSLAHGFFLVVFLGVLTANGKGTEVLPDWPNLVTGCVSVLIFVTVGFLLDLPDLGKRSFFWIEQLAEGNLVRVIIIHLGLIFGLLAVGLTGATSAFFSVFIALKTLNDLNAVIPQWNPDEPPRWLCALMDKIPASPKNVKATESFADFWKRDKAEEIARRQRNEEAFSSR